MPRSVNAYASFSPRARFAAAVHVAQARGDWSPTRSESRLAPPRSSKRLEPQQRSRRVAAHARDRRSEAAVTLAISVGPASGAGGRRYATPYLIVYW